MGEEGQFRGPPPKVPLEQIDNYTWRIPQKYKQGMKVPGLVYADAAMLDLIMQDQSLEQVANVATLPGIVARSMAMPDTCAMFF